MKNPRLMGMTAPKLTVILLISASFMAGCNSAPPPRSIEDSANSTSRQKMIPARDQKAIDSASNVQITKLDGGTFKLSDFRGKVVVVDFWATNCKPCVELVPKLANLSKKYRDQGLEVVGLTSDERENEKQVQEFLKRAGADYLVGYENQWLVKAFLKGTEDETYAAPIPQVFVISRDGQVVDHFIGANPQRGIADLEQSVSQQLASR